MKDKELTEHEHFEAKYVRELLEYWNAYMFALITEIFVGVGINLGLSEKEAYKLAKNDPKKLEKASFFKNVFEKFKFIFNYKVPKFRYKQKKLYNEGKPLTPKQWSKFNEYMDNYWKEYANKVTGDVTIKAHELGKTTTNYRKKKVPYKNKSLYQVSFEQYDNKIPKNIESAYKNFDFNNAEKKVLNKSFSDVAMYVTRTNDEVKNAIREQVQRGLDKNLSSIEVASNLYHEVEKNPELLNKYTAEGLRKNWQRVANTEMSMLVESGILAPYESQAMESLKNSEKSAYFIRQGGTCEWCLPRRGTLVRLVPTDIVTNTSNESLRAMGIKDPNTDVAIWNGKNNVGIKQKDFLICCPAHPYNTATFAPIDIKDEYYNKKTDSVEKRQEKKKYIPQREDYRAKIKDEKEDRKPTLVSNNLVRFNNNLYTAVEPDDFNKKLAEWRKSPDLPIPVNKKSPQYEQIFKEAEKNK